MTKIPSRRQRSVAYTIENQISNADNEEQARQMALQCNDDLHSGSNDEGVAQSSIIEVVNDINEVAMPNRNHSMA